MGLKVTRRQYIEAEGGQ